MNILFLEIRLDRKATVIWTLALIAIAALYISIWPSLSDSMATGDMLKNFPETFKKAFGISDETLSAFAGIYAMILNMILLAGAVQAMNLGLGVTSREVREKTADFLFTRPVSRMSVLRQKLMAAVSLLIFTDLVFMGISWIIIWSVIDDPFRFGTFMTSTLSLVLIQAFFLSLGYMLGAVLPKVRSVIAVTLPVVFGFYVLGLLDTVVGEEKIKYMTPFKSMNLQQLTAGGGYEASTVIYLLVLAAAAIAASFIVFRRKDIHTL